MQTNMDTDVIYSERSSIQQHTEVLYGKLVGCAEDHRRVKSVNRRNIAAEICSNDWRGAHLSNNYANRLAMRFSASCATMPYVIKN